MLLIKSKIFYLFIVFNIGILGAQGPDYCKSIDECKQLCDSTEIGTFSPYACSSVAELFLSSVSFENYRRAEINRKIKEQRALIEKMKKELKDFAGELQNLRKLDVEYAMAQEYFVYIISTAVYASNKGCFMSSLAGQERWLEIFDDKKAQGVAENCSRKGILLLRYRTSLGGEIGSIDPVTDADIAFTHACLNPKNNKDKWGYCSTWAHQFYSAAQADESSFVDLMAYSVNAAKTAYRERGRKNSLEFFNDALKEMCAKCEDAGQLYTYSNCKPCATLNKPGTTPVDNIPAPSHVSSHAPVRPVIGKRTGSNEWPGDN